MVAPIVLALALLLSGEEARGEDRLERFTSDMPRPDPAGPPTKVSIGIFLVDVSAIDDASRHMTVDFALTATWKDPRLARQGQTSVPLSDVWNPNLQILGDQNLRKTRPDIVRIDDDGVVHYGQRFIGDVQFKSDLSDFPFDEQLYAIRVVTPMYSPSEIELIGNEDLTGQGEELSAVDWQFAEGSLRSEPYRFGPARQEFASVAYELIAKRRLGFYGLNVIIPLALVVFMSWSVFWIDPATSGPQISVAVTSILTLIAYRFMVGQMVPQISYLTRLDVFTLGASVLVFLALGEAIWTSRLAATDELLRAQRMDERCRWIFPAVFALLALVSFAL